MSNQVTINQIETVVVESDCIFSNLLAELKKNLNGISLSPLNMHTIIKDTMELIEVTPLKGSQQKNFALRLLRELFKEVTDGSEEAALLSLIDNGVVANIMDLIIDASKGKLNINTVTKTTQGCFSILGTYFTSKAKNLSKKK